MYGLDNNSGINAMPAVAPTVSPTPLWFTDGGANQPPSYPGQDWFNMFQAEHLNVLAEAGLTPNKTDLNQLAKAIKKIISSGDNGLLKTENNLSEIKAAGAPAIAAALANLGLGNDAHLSGNLTVAGGFWDTAPSATPARVWSPNNKPSLSTLGVVDATTLVKGIVELATNAEMVTGTSSSLVPTVAAVMSILSKRTFSTSDYIRIPDVPGGLIIQWVKGKASATGVLFAQMPTVFPNKLLLAGAFEAGAALWGNDSATTWGVDFDNSTTTQVIAYVRRLFPTTINTEAASGLVLAIGN
ncbi:gp53-like domain-containing protein [Yersinia aldovae]|uniref:gp53-like domain-containing protein n=1 Tax=Yersinia aldovae TaxID=29483 RepID=UPI0011A7E449|nr:hypothetical protein [Yersinia aldovae]